MQAFPTKKVHWYENFQGNTEHRETLYAVLGLCLKKSACSMMLSWAWTDFLLTSALKTEASNAWYA